jgi:hypothetical protein
MSTSSRSGEQPELRLETFTDAIDAAYRRLGHTRGWRFLTGPRASFATSTRVAFVSLNPGGDSEPAEHPRASCEAGSSYWTESWVGHAPGQAPLQIQVQRLFDGLRRHLGVSGETRAWVEAHVVTTHFIPFRSARLVDLPYRAESIAFANELWRDILAVWSPRIILTIDREAFSSIGTLLLQGSAARELDRASFDTGWGNYRSEAVRILRSDRPVTLARLPHLSTFKLFSRPECAPHLYTFLSYVATPSG